MNKRNLEMIVGSFVLLAIVIFFIIVFFISGVYFLREGYSLKVMYDYTGGLDKGAPVKLAGVRVGEVNKVVMDYDEETKKPKAIVELWMKQDAKVREGSKAYIYGIYSLSEAHIEICSDGESEGHLLEDGDMLVGIDPIPMERLIARGEQISTKLEHVVMRVESIIKDDETQEAIKQIIHDTRDLFNAFYHVMVQRGDDVDEVMNDLQSAADNLNAILEEIRAGEGTAGQLLLNDELYNEMKELVREIKLHPWRLLKKDDEKKKKLLGLF